MPDSASARLKCGLACLLIATLTVAGLLTNLWAIGELPWRVTTYSTPPRPHTPTPTPTPGPTSENEVEATARHLRIFTELWEIVHDEYLYPDYNGADWEATGQEYRARVEAGLDDEEFWATLDEMLAELHDEHSIFLSPTEVTAEEGMRSGELDYVGIGVYTAALPEKGYAVVLLVMPDSPAARAGLRPHDCILSVDGRPACCDVAGDDTLEHLFGPEGSIVELRVQTSGEPPRTVTVTRALIQGPLPVEARRLD